MKKILLTGGHLSPLLATYEVLKGKSHISIIGRRFTFQNDRTESLEYTLFKNEKVPFYVLNAPRLQRTHMFKLFTSSAKLPESVLQAMEILKKEKPDVVIIFGGYIGFPVAFAAYLKRIPIIIHEQTQGAGLTNRIIGKIAVKICISYPSSAKYFPKSKTILTGNPVRAEVFEVKKEIEISEDKPLLYITGGSSGAHFINEFVLKNLQKLLTYFSVIHQTGDAKEYNDFEKLLKEKEKLSLTEQKRYVVKKFIFPEEIGWIYKNSGIILSRAGINTVNELITLQKKALLIPLPHGQKNEQLQNAQLYEQNEIGEYILQSKADDDTILKHLLALQEKNISKRANNNWDSAAEKIAQVVLN